MAALAAAKLPQELAAGEEPVLADCGRLYPGSPALAVAAAAALTLLVVRPRVSELAHLEPRVRGLEQAGLRLVRRPGGRRPPAAGRAVLPGRGDRRRPRRPRAGTLPADPRAVEQLCRRAGDPGPARRLPLLREAAAAAGALEAALGHPPAAPDLPGGPQDLDETEAVVGDRG